MSRSISPMELAQSMETLTIVDVRKEPARAQSGSTIAGSERRLPGEAQQWAVAYRGRSVVVFCVHGHEVSQSACDLLVEAGAAARFLEGGFEAWRDAGNPVEPIGASL